MKRTTAKYENNIFSAHDLTMESLGIYEIQSAEEKHNQKFYKKNQGGFDVLVKNQIIKNWKSLTSDEIIEKLKDFAPRQMSENKLPDANWESEILLLRALAFEKSLLKNRKTTSKTYFECREGEFFAELVLNNLAVLATKEGSCDEALNYLSQSILTCIRRQFYLKAPFYNFVLIINQLDIMGLMIEERNSVLENVLKHIKPDFENDTKEKTTFEKLRVIIRFLESSPVLETANRDLENSEFYEKQANYLVPQIDILNSFGDKVSPVHYRVFYEQINKADELAGEGKYAESFDQLEFASKATGLFITYKDNSSKSLESTLKEKKLKIRNLWRASVNEEIEKKCKSGNFFEAIDVLTINKKAFQPEEEKQIEELIGEIKTMYYSDQLEQISALILKGENKHAAAMCENLLIDPEINEFIRNKITKYLIELQEGK